MVVLLYAYDVHYASIVVSVTVDAVETGVEERGETPTGLFLDRSSNHVAGNTVHESTTI